MNRSSSILNKNFNMKIRRAVISGSFHKDNETLSEIYDELALANCQILSLFTTKFEDNNDEFVANEFERRVDPFQLELRHLMAIEQADFVWLHSPGGYVGISTAFELGFAYAKNKKVYSKDHPAEQILNPLINKVTSVFDALKMSNLL